MNERVEAWVLARGGKDIERQQINLPDISDKQVLVAPLFGSWEANMSHAVLGDPIDICRQRREASVVLGNAGVVRVLRPGAEVSSVKEGDVCLFLAGAKLDSYGFVELVHGYDAPGTVGLLAQKTVVEDHNLLKIPEGSKFSLQQWAAFSVKYITAWSNWNTAYSCYRTQMGEVDSPQPWVWGWGGGTTFAELSLAKFFGCRTAMISGSEENLTRIAKSGIDPVDRRLFPDLSFDQDRFLAEREYRLLYKKSEAKFLRAVKVCCGDSGVSIFVDYIGSPVFRASLKALSRQGVITTAGWKLGMNLSLKRANECISRRIHVHTHYARLKEIPEAVMFAEDRGWMPRVTDEFEWAEVRELAFGHISNGLSGYFPVFNINQDYRD